jgi:hypothetical protein
MTWFNRRLGAIQIIRDPMGEVFTKLDMLFKTQIIILFEVEKDLAREHAQSYKTFRGLFRCLTLLT